MNTRRLSTLVTCVILLFGVLLLAACAKPSPTPAPKATPVPTVTTTVTATPAPAPTVTTTVTATPAQVIEWTFMATTPGVEVEVAKKWSDLIWEKSGQRLRLRVQLRDVLGIGFDQQLGALERGEVPIGTVSGGLSVGTEPMLAVIELPFLTTYDKVLTIGQTARPFLEKAWNKHNSIFLGVSTFPDMMWSKKAIMSAESVKGMKIRMSSPTTKEVFTRLGASVVTIPVGEVYTALQTGVIDAVNYGAVTGNTSKYYEVAKYFMKGPVLITGGSISLAVNKDRFNALPKDLQDILKGNAEAHSRFFHEGYSTTPELVKIFEANGVTVYDMPQEEVVKFKTVAETVSVEWGTSKGAEVLEGVKAVLAAAK